MTDFSYGSLAGDLAAADAALASAVRANDFRGQQRACAFALAAVQRAFPMGQEYSTLARLTFGLQRVIDGASDDLFRPVIPARSRPLPARQLDGLAVLFVRLYSEAGVSRKDSFVKVAALFSAAGMTSHGGGRRADSDSAGISRAVTAGSIKSLWSQSQRGKRLESVGQYADQARELLRGEGLEKVTEEKIRTVFNAITQKPISTIELLTTPARSET